MAGFNSADVAEAIASTYTINQEACYMGYTKNLLYPI